jgi:hypothetical protein
MSAVTAAFAESGHGGPVAKVHRRTPGVARRSGQHAQWAPRPHGQARGDVHGVGGQGLIQRDAGGRLVLTKLGRAALDAMIGSGQGECASGMET